jgi:hypothetical protein
MKMVSHSLTQGVIKQKRADTPDGMAYCSHCDQYKDRSEFTIDRKAKNGLLGYCRDCLRISRSTSEYLVKRKNYESSPQGKARRKAFDASEKRKAYRASPEYKSKSKERSSSPEFRAKQRAYHATPERRAKRRAYQSTQEFKEKDKLRRSTEKQKAATAASVRKTKYGISYHDYQALLNAQNGVCAICKKPETKMIKNSIATLAVDHDHETGAIRGLLCYACNLGLGNFKDSPENLSNAIDYLKRFNQK